MNKSVFISAALMVLSASGVLANNELAVLTEIEKVKIVTQNGRPADCLSPIAINKIDGEQKVVPAQGFSIEPGVHTLNGRAIIDTTFCAVGRGGNIPGNAPDLEVDFEVGKTYYIGYDHKSVNRDDWRLVVWKVEDNLPVSPDAPDIEQR